MKLESNEISCKAQDHRAFTLVELLVVIGIIAVMISLLMPALTKARNSALQVKCAANMKQQFLGMMLYTNMYNGKYPKPGTSFGMASGNYGGVWPHSLIYVGAMGPVDLPNENTAGSGDWDRTFRPRMTTAFLCPVVDRSTTNDVRTGSYAMSGSLYDAGSTTSTPPRPEKYSRVTDVKVPGRMFLITENRNTITSGHVTIDRPDINQPDRWRTRHHKGGNYIFADGHHEWISQAEINKQILSFVPAATAWPYWQTAPVNIFRLPIGNADR